MNDLSMPENAEELQSVVRDALLTKRTLELLGHGSRRALGRPVSADVRVDLSRLQGVKLYEPEELILVVGPGTPLTDLKQMLADHGQHLAFEPPDYGVLWGEASDQGTVGGAIMSGRNGPRRLTAGGARDFVLGAKAVNGRGEQFAAGGRVVKNVTGFDLPKLIAGSFGTLCAVTELTLKVLPKPPEVATFAVLGLAAHQASLLMQKILKELSAQISSVAFLPADVVVSSSVDDLSKSGTSALLFRMEGFGMAVSSGLGNISKLLKGTAPSLILDEDQTHQLWTEIGDVHFFSGSNKPVWFLSVPPSLGAEIGEYLIRELHGKCFYDWAGGGIWLELPDESDAAASVVRSSISTLANNDGHATLIRAEQQVRSHVSPFQPQPPALAQLIERVRRQFDPAGVFNPGRMYENTDAN